MKRTKRAKIVSRKALIEDMRRVLRTFPTAQPDRDFYRVHGKYSDAAVKVHFSRFKDFAAAAVPEMTPDEAFKLAVRSLDRAIDLIQKWHEDAKYGEGWVKHQIDVVNARVHELDELFYMWRLVKTIDDKEEQGEPIPTVLPDPEFLEEKQ
jgi:hypothetical protein